MLTPADRARIPRLQRELKAAMSKSERACQTRASLPPGSSRAKVTTDNARWKSAAEARDRIAAELLALIAQDGGL
jgi:hypothetical protein